MNIDEKIRLYILSEKFKDCPVLDDRQKYVVLSYVRDKMNYSKIAKNIDRCTAQIKNILNRSIMLLEFYLNEKTPDTLIQNTGLSKRIKNGFRDDDEIKKLRDFNNYCSKKLLKRNIGQKSVNEINNYIKDLGFSINFDKIKNIKPGFKKKNFENYSDDEILFLISSLIKFIKDRRNKK
jgi:hypothetical protein